MISKKRLREFWEIHRDAEMPLLAWFSHARKAEWDDFAEIRGTFSASASHVNRCTVFNLGGNKYRLVVRIDFQWRKVFVVGVFTHLDYDRGGWKGQC